MPNDPVEIRHKVGTATVQRSSLPVWLRHGWSAAEPSDVISTDASVADVLASVGDDPALARAAAAVERAGKGRTTLLHRLDAIANAPQE